MATTTTCDICPGEPRQENEEFKPSAAMWKAAAKALDSNVLTTMDELDACDRHLGEAVKKLANKYGLTRDNKFHKIEVLRL